MFKKCGYLLYFCTAIFLFFFGMKLLKEKGVSDDVILADNDLQDKEHARIALTFDDGPHAVYTPAMLDALKERDVKASFFLIGKCISGNEEIVKRIKDEGHLIGNHTFNHVQLNKLSDEKACQEITKTSNLIYEITGVYTAYVRPPFGEWKKDLDCNVTMLPVMWSIDSLDWTTSNVDGIVKRVLKNIKDGDIILMHDGYDSTVKAALRIIDELQKRGFEFVTVDELLLD